jgi:hypothetical protein
MVTRAGEQALKGPYVTAASDTGGTVRFELEGAAPAAVEVVREAVAEGKERSVTGKRVFESRDASSMHVVSMTGLEPATRYAYAVRAEHAVVADGHFVTAPRPGSAAATTFLVYGDDRTDHDAHAAVVRAMMQVPSDLLIQTGDLVSDGGSAQDWQTFFDIEKALLRERPILAAIGNHELYDDAAGANFLRYFGFPDASGSPRPYGTVRFGNVRFFFLNGMHGWASGEERQWLERELARADTETGLVWRVAVAHHGPWSGGPHGPNAQLVDARVPELLVAHKVDLFLAGHDHLYERGDAGPIKYLVTGGAGAPLYRDFHPTATTRKIEAVHHFVELVTSTDAIRIVARRTDGTVVDRCGFVKGGGWDCDAADAGPPARRASTTATVEERPAVAAAETKGPPQPSARPESARCLCVAPGSATHRAAGGAAMAALIGLALTLRRLRS